MRGVERVRNRTKVLSRTYSPGAVTKALNSAAWAAAPRWAYMFSPVDQSQLWPSRAGAMRRVLRENFTSAVNFLEVGTWFGEGSTPLWLSALPSGSHLVLLDSWRPYVSSQDKREGLRHYLAMDLVPFAAWHNVARRVFTFERKSDRIDISVLRGDSRRALPLMAPDTFDVVFVDGSHYYTDVKHGVQEAVRVAKQDFALICGDDLELVATPELLALAQQAPDSDTIGTPQGSIHPGVMLAVHEVLGEVNVEAGFWWTFVVAGAVDPGGARS